MKEKESQSICSSYGLTQSLTMKTGIDPALITCVFPASSGKGVGGEVARRKIVIDGVLRILVMLRSHLSVGIGRRHYTMCKELERRRVQPTSGLFASIARVLPKGEKKRRTLVKAKTSTPPPSHPPPNGKNHCEQATTALKP